MSSDETLIGSFYGFGCRQDPSLEEIGADHLRIKSEGILIAFIFHFKGASGSRRIHEAIQRGVDNERHLAAFFFWWSNPSMDQEIRDCQNSAGNFAGRVNEVGLNIFWAGEPEW